MIEHGARARTIIAMAASWLLGAYGLLVLARSFMRDRVIRLDSFGLTYRLRLSTQRVAWMEITQVEEVGPGDGAGYRGRRFRVVAKNGVVVTIAAWPLAEPIEVAHQAVVDWWQRLRQAER